MDDYKLALMAGVDIPVPELKLVIHPPTIKDIAFMGEQEFFTAIQYLCLDKEALVQDKTVLQGLTNFQVLMKVLEQQENKPKKAALSTLLLLLFPNQRSVIMPKSIVITSGQEGAEPIMIDDGNFDILQDMVKEVTCISSLFQRQNIVYKPKGRQAEEIARKIKIADQKIAKQKAERGETAESVLTRYLSILTIGAGMRLEDCVNYNLFQLFDLIERYGAYVEWNTDLRVRLAGGKPDKQVESWMRNLHSNK